GAVHRRDRLLTIALPRSSAQIQAVQGTGGSGGIGRRTRLRIWRRKAWGFESPLSHQLSQARWSLPQFLRPAVFRLVQNAFPKPPCGTRFSVAKTITIMSAHVQI